LPDDARPVVTWRVAVRRLAFDGATATIEVRWSRDVERDDIQPASDFEGTFTWRPMEGEERVLDLVRQAAPAQARCDTQTVTLRYRPDGPEELSDAAIGYDIWLVQELPSGERRTRHLQTAARQADVVRFAFPPVGVDAPRLTDPPGPTILDVSVNGQIRGRVRRDGRVDLAVDAGRLVMPRNRGLGTGNSGRTRLTVAAGETVELQPPPLFGNTDGSFADALRNARTAIRVRARRLW
jgi:hypothetical protein